MKNDEYMWINTIYKRQINNFYKKMGKYCRKEKIENDFSKFLFYKWNGINGTTYAYLFLLPKVYLVNSKSFMDYYNKLHKDFQDDILDRKEIKNIKKELKKNTELQQFLKKIMDKDSIL
jgi:hypothetical protein